MSEKNIKARIVHKHDTEANWLKSSFIPLKGELVVFDIDENYSYERLKIGDGVTNVNNLPFVDDALRTEFGEHEHDNYVVNHGTSVDDVEIVSSSGVTLTGGVVGVGVENNLKGVRIYKNDNITSGAFYIKPYDRGNAITIENSKGVLSLLSGSSNLRITGVDTPSSDSDAANKLYVDTAVSGVSTLVGDTPVSEQIAASQIVYVGPTAPTDPNIKVWINTAEEGTGIVPVLPRIATITLTADGWTGNSAPYSQAVEINTVTSATKIDLQPTVAQIVDLQNQDIALMVENTDGSVVVYSFGGKPSSDMTMQALLQEVSYV